MVPRALTGPIVLLAVTFAGGCDVKQSLPETGAETAVPLPAVAVPAQGTVQAPAEAQRIPGADAPDERSIRLFGRGVSRQRQTRV
jgi:hypothetical protein